MDTRDENRITIRALHEMTDDEVREWLPGIRAQAERGDDPDERREMLAFVERIRAERDLGAPQNGE